MQHSTRRRALCFKWDTGYRMDQHPSARSCTSRGTSSCEAVPAEPSMNLYIHSTTGTRFELSLPQEETVEGLKRRLSQRLKVPKERLALLHKETRLSSGKLQDLGISDGSKLTLVPTVEAGLMSTKVDMTGGEETKGERSGRVIQRHVRLCLYVVSPGNLGIVDRMTTYAIGQLRP
ncbi:hypothetical protein GOODEAATRI_000458 [Goodea atripinnis]|uniref:Ubiquitin-like domain-containing protein n=1 Tax=Goodea atripinnis TaxID=208336 RepID=A0ABV0P078_9TELE